MPGSIDPIDTPTHGLSAVIQPIIPLDRPIATQPDPVAHNAMPAVQPMDIVPHAAAPASQPFPLDVTSPRPADTPAPLGDTHREPAPFVQPVDTVHREPIQAPVSNVERPADTPFIDERRVRFSTLQVRDTFWI